MEQITEHVFVETKVRGCNPGFVVTSDGVVLIDTGIDLDFAKKWAQEISKRGKVRYIINTEHHMDHFVSNSCFDGEIISHEATRKTILTMDLNFIRKRSEVLYIDPLPIPEGYQLKIPNITYSQHMTLYVGGLTFQLIHTPGHTAGQTAVYIPEERVVFTGDNVVGQVRTAWHDALPTKWIESLKMLEKLDFHTIVPGHGEICEKDYLGQQASIVRNWIAATEESKKEGVEIDEAVRRRVDPFFVKRDTGMKFSVILGATLAH
jgi:cyclase